MNRKFWLLASGLAALAGATSSTAQIKFEGLQITNGLGVMTLQAPAAGAQTLTIPNPGGAATFAMTTGGFSSFFTGPTADRTYTLPDANATLLSTAATTLSASTSLTTPLILGGTTATSFLTLKGSSNGAPTSSYVVVNGDGRPTDFGSASGIFMGRDNNNYGIEIVQQSATPYLDFTRQAATDFDARLILKGNDELNLDGADFTFEGSAARTIKVNAPAAGAGSNLTVKAADAFVTSGANGGNLLLSGGANDGAGLNGAVVVSGAHLRSTQTTAPTAGTSSGTISLLTLTTASDVAGKVSFTVTSGVLNDYAEIAFNRAFATAPIVVITPANAATALAVTQFYVTPATTNFRIALSNGGLTGNYAFFYHVIETQ